MQRSFEPAPQKFRDEGESNRRETLHVGDAAAIKPVVDERRFERRRFPRLAVDRNNVAVSGQHDAAIGGVSFTRRKRREKVRLSVVIVEGQLRIDAKAGQVVAHPIDKRQVRLAAGRIEAHQRPNEIEPNEIGGEGGGDAHDPASHCRAIRIGTAPVNVNCALRCADRAGNRETVNIEVAAQRKGHPIIPGGPCFSTRRGRSFQLAYQWRW